MPNRVIGGQRVRRPNDTSISSAHAPLREPSPEESAERAIDEQPAGVMTRAQAKGTMLAFLLLAPGSLFTPWLATPLWLLALPGVLVLAVRLNRDRTSSTIDSVAGVASAVALLATLFVQAITVVLALIRQA